MQCIWILYTIEKNAKSFWTITILRWTCHLEYWHALISTLWLVWCFFLWMILKLMFFLSYFFGFLFLLHDMILYLIYCSWVYASESLSILLVFLLKNIILYQLGISSCPCVFAFTCACPCLCGWRAAHFFIQCKIVSNEFLKLKESTQQRFCKS